jgi:hypothetical protein
MRFDLMWCGVKNSIVHLATLADRPQALPPSAQVAQSRECQRDILCQNGFIPSSPHISVYIRS